MKILMILESDFPPDIRVENEIEFLYNLGHEITIACLTQKIRPGKEKLKHATVIRKRISKLRKKTSVGSLRAPFYFNFWRHFLNDVFSQQSFDAIHVHDLPLAKVGYEFKCKKNIPLIVDLHENWPALIKDAKHTNTLLGKILSSNKQWVKYESTILQSADRIITVVEEMKSRIVKHGISPEKVFIVSNYMNLNSKIQESSKTFEGKVLYYAGGINKHRGLQVVIKGLALLSPDYGDIKLKIVGYGNYEKQLEKLTAELSLNDRIVFLGKKNQRDTYKEMMNSDILLIPHIRSVQTDNSSPNKLFQYMYAEKPVLASNCISVERIINKEKAGLVYEHDNPKDFAEKLVSLINLNANNFMGRNGKKAVLKKYNWEVNSSVLEKIYSSF